MDSLAAILFAPLFAVNGFTNFELLLIVVVLYLFTIVVYLFFYKRKKRSEEPPKSYLRIQKASPWTNLDILTHPEIYKGTKIRLKGHREFSGVYLGIGGKGELLFINDIDGEEDSLSSRDHWIKVEFLRGDGSVIIKR